MRVLAPPPPPPPLLALLLALLLVAPAAHAELHMPSILGSSSGRTPGKAKARADVPAKGGRPHQGVLARKFRQEAKRLGKGAQVVFLGDSITEHMRGSSMGKMRSDRKDRVWAKERYSKGALYFGVAHEETQHVLHRIKGGELDHVQPKAVVTLIGTNNLGIGKMGIEDTAKGIVAVARAVHDKVPGARVFVQALIPRGPDWPGGRFGELITSLNRVVEGEVREMAGKEDWVEFLDCNRGFLERGKMSRKLMPDNLHPSLEGHKRWADCLRPHLQRALT